MTEFNLSNFEQYVVNFPIDKPMISSAAVKEFIKRLKEEIAFLKIRLEEIDFRGLSYSEFKEVIAGRLLPLEHNLDNLVGEKLTKEEKCKLCDGRGTIGAPCPEGRRGCLVYHTQPCPYCAGEFGGMYE